MPTLPENDDYDKCVNTSSTFGMILRDKLRPMPHMYLPDINSISQKKKLVRNSSYRWMTSHSSDGSCYLSGCCSGCSQESGTVSQGRQKRRIHKKNRKKEKVNKLVIPVRTSDKTIKIYVPGKEPTHNKEDDTVQRKSSITRMIDDFYDIKGKLLVQSK